MSHLRLPWVRTKIWQNVLIHLSFSFQLFHSNFMCFVFLSIFSVHDKLETVLSYLPFGLKYIGVFTFLRRKPGYSCHYPRYKELWGSHLWKLCGNVLRKGYRACKTIIGTSFAHVLANIVNIHTLFPDEFGLSHSLHNTTSYTLTLAWISLACICYKQGFIILGCWKTVLHIFWRDCNV